MKVLNEPLYSALMKVFGSVKIYNQGTQMTARPVKDAITQRKKIHVITAGEYYAICCPKCGDTRHRLWINHRYNTEFEGIKLTGKACCYNERCEQTKGFFEELDRKIARHVSLGAYVPVDTISNEPFTHPNVSLPGFCKSFDLLEETHLAKEYIRLRGFDPAKLQDDWGVCWCEYCDDFKEASHRIIIPVGDETGMIGWQARYVGSKQTVVEGYYKDGWFGALYAADGTPPEGVPKFYTMPGMKKSHIVFNLCRAKAYGCPVITEGPFDAMMIGKEHGLAIFGTTISANQKQLLAKAYTGPSAEVALVALDNDEAGISGALEAVESLRSVFKQVINIQLPKDPSDYESTIKSWTRIFDELIARYGRDSKEFKAVSCMVQPNQAVAG